MIDSTGTQGTLVVKLIGVCVCACGLVVFCACRNGAGTVKVTVDSHVVATGQFKLNSHGHAAWSDLTALQK